MKARVVARLGLLVVALVMVTSVLPVLGNIWGAGSIILSYAGASPAVSTAWTAANMISGAIWAASGVGAPIAIVQLA